MALLEKQLVVKTSTIPGAGKGLFTSKSIPKGTLIVEYKGKVSTWKDVEHDGGNNGYIYYLTRNHVINAANHKAALARYANDARGIGRVKGVLNNSHYVSKGNLVYIESLKDIPAGGEILVSYGHEYWDVIRYNLKIDEDEKKERLQEAKKADKVKKAGRKAKKATTKKRKSA
jgi:hypothetical protein